MKFELVEPLRQLFKDEVRRRRGPSSASLKEIVQRQPFPGPGLAVRILGPVTDERPLRIVRDADAIVIGEMKKIRPVLQGLAVVCGAASRAVLVGVMGERADLRLHDRASRVVQSHDGMTADGVRLP